MTEIKKQIDILASSKERWMNLSIKKRTKFIKTLRYLIVDKQNEIANAITLDTGKPVTESMMQEVSASLGMLKYFESNFPGWLKERQFKYFRPGFIFKKNIIKYDPLGVVAVISPANYPFSLPVMQTAFALLCGNCVVLKPSEKAVHVNKVIISLFENSGLTPESVLVIEGDEKPAEEIIRHEEVRKIIFTGSYENGRKVTRLAAEHFKPVILELGGDGPAIVLNDANLSLAAKSIIWSHCYSNYNSCIGTKIVFVQKAVISEMKNLLEVEFSKINFGASDNTNTDACIKYKKELNSLNVIEFTSEDEAIRKVNELPTGLSASVWSNNIRRARMLANKINCGMIWINDLSVGIPGIAWGGSKLSGWGRLFARSAIPELTNTKTISIEKRFTSRPKFWQYPYVSDKYEITKVVNSIVFGKGSIKQITKVMGKYFKVLFKNHH